MSENFYHSSAVQQQKQTSNFNYFDNHIRTNNHNEEKKPYNGSLCKYNFIINWDNCWFLPIAKQLSQIYNIIKSATISSYVNQCI